MSFSFSGNNQPSYSPFTFGESPKLPATDPFTFGAQINTSAKSPVIDQSNIVENNKIFPTSSTPFPTNDISLTMAQKQFIRDEAKKKISKYQKKIIKNQQVLLSLCDE